MDITTLPIPAVPGAPEEMFSSKTREGRIIWVADARRGDGKRFVVHADEKLTAFVELEAATRAASVELRLLRNPS